MPSHNRSVPPPLALLLLYATSGLLWGAWIERIDATRHRLDLSQSELGIVLPAFPIGAIVAFPLVAMFTERFGSRTSVIGFGLLRAAVFPLLGLAPDMPALMGALALSGFAHGGLEISLNTQGVEYERETSKSILAYGAAASSIGMLASTFGVWLYSRTDLPFETPFLIPAIIGVAMFLILGSRLLPDGPKAQPTTVGPVQPARVGWRGWIPPHVLWVLLVFAFVSEVADEAVSEWVSIFLHDDLKSGPGISSAQYSTYTLTLLLGRLVSGAVTRRVAPLRILQLGGVFGGIGMLVGIAINTSTAVLIGTGIIGLGTSLFLPTVYRLAGSAPGIARSRSLAMVETTVYLGYMVGPLVIGPLSDATSLRFALLSVGVLYFTIPVLGQLSRSTRFEPLVPPYAPARVPAPPEDSATVSARQT
jgi:MFS family permease